MGSPTDPVKALPSRKERISCGQVQDLVTISFLFGRGFLLSIYVQWNGAIPHWNVLSLVGREAVPSQDKQVLFGPVHS